MQRQVLLPKEVVLEQREEVGLGEEEEGEEAVVHPWVVEEEPD